MRVGHGLGLALLPVFAGACDPGIDRGTAPSEADVRRLVAALDQAFDQGDSAAYLANLVPTHAQEFDRHAARMARALESGKLRRQSELRSFRVLDEQRSLALVATETRLPGSEADPHRATELMVLTDRGGNLPVATLTVEVDADHLQNLDRTGKPNHFACAACNYAVDSDSSWLLVPHRRLRVGCLEAISYYSLEHDLRFDLSVHDLGKRAEAAPAAVLAALGEVALATEDWLPPRYRDEPPTGILGARATALAKNPGREAELFLCTYGGIGYLMALSGPEAELRTHRESITALLGSFRLLATPKPPEGPTHAPGTLVDGRYEDRVLRFAAPPYWAARSSLDHGHCQVTYVCPEGSGTIRVRALQPPDGADRWSMAAATTMLEESLQQNGRTMLADSDWQPTAAGRWDRSREIRLDHGEARSHRLRIAFDPQLVVIVEGEGDARRVEPMLDATFDSLERR